MSAAIEAHRLFAVHHTPTRAVVALQGLTFALEQGEFVALLGPSGAGKSTLMRCLAGLHRPLAGELYGFGVRLHDANPRALARWRATHVGIISQRYLRSLSPDLTVLRLVMLRAALSGQRDRAGALELLDRVGLADRADARRDELSGGEQQRVAVCAALHSRHALLLADEITGDLDDEAAAEVMTLLRELARERGTAIVLATHDTRNAALADRVVTIRDGRITTETTAAQRRIMLDDSGLVRFEPDDLEHAGIATRARLDVRPGRIMLSADGNAPTARSTPELRFAGPKRQIADVSIALRGVERRYGAIRVLGPLDLVLTEPGLHAIVGPSGSGKTTLLNIVSGLERATSGSIKILGVDVTHLDRTELARFRARHVSVVPQSGALIGHLTARENVEFALRLRGADVADVDASLSAVGLGELADRRAAGLSGGEQQRLAVARCLATATRILAVDEPSASLDQANAITIAHLLRKLAHEYSALVLCATHDRSIVERADNVIELVSEAGARTI